MQDNGLLTAIDVGTSKISTILGRKVGAGQIEFLAHSMVPSRGVRKGNVADVRATHEAVRQSVDDVRRQSGKTVASAYVGVTGGHVDFENLWRSMSWAGAHGFITAHDLSRIQTEVDAAVVGDNRRMIHTLAREYSVDGYSGIRNPEGMHSKDVRVGAHVVTGSADAVDTLVGSVEQAGIRVAGLVLQPLASSEATLTQSEREGGAAIVDLGCGTTDIVVFKGGAVTYSAAIPVGGYQFTNDICLTYGTPFQAAEDVKLRYASTEPYTVRTDEDVMLDVDGQRAPLRLPRRDLCLLMRERAHELSRLVLIKLREAGFDGDPDFSVVITGGSATMPGLDQLMHRTLGTRVRVGAPDRPPGLPESLRSPAHSTGVGIMVWALKQERELAEARRMNGAGEPGASSGGSMFARFFKRVRPVLQTGQDDTAS